MKRIVYITLAATLLAILVAGCAGKKPVELGFEKPQFQKAPPELMAKIVNAGDAFSYPDANMIIIETIDSAVYNEDGTVTQFSYYLAKPLTPQGLKDASTEELSYDNQMMTVDVLYAVVIHPDSTVEFVPDSAITDQVASEGMAEMDIYWTNLRKKIIHFPQLYPGDAVAVAYKYAIIKPYFEGVISGISGFQATEPIHKNRAVALIPKSVAEGVKVKILNDKNNWVKLQEYDKGDYHIIVVEADSVPAFVPEVGMPSAKKFIPIMMFSNVTWKELSRKAWEVTEPPMKITDPDLKKTVKALVETCKTEIDSIKAIARWVAQDVRYIGLSLGEKEGITPHDVNETFRARAGVCKDKAALGVAMLRAAGIEAYNVLTNPVDDVLYDVATNQFNHQIAVAITRSGEKYFIDETVDISDELPGYYSKRGYLILTKEGEDLHYFPLIGPEKNHGVINAKSKIDADGNLKSTVEISGNGIYDLALRQIAEFLSPDDIKRLVRQLISAIDPGAKLDTFILEPEDVKNLDVPAKLTIKYEIPDYAVPAGKYLLLSAPCAQHTFDIMKSTIEEYTKLEDRKFPLRFMYTLSSDITETIELPSSYKAKSIPEPVKIDTKYFDYNMEYSIEGNVLKYHCSLSLNDVDIPLKDYPGFRKAVADYKNSEKGMLFLTK